MSQDAEVIDTTGQAETVRPGLTSEAGTGRPYGAATGRYRRLPWLAAALVAGYLLHVAWRLWLTRGLIAPAAHADEDAYLIAARALAGGPGGGTTENEAFRRLGYPLLISPVYWFTSDAFEVYRGVRVINALLNSLALPLAYLFARQVLALARPTALAAAFAVASMPAVAFYAEFALTDAVLAPVGLLWLWLAYRWLAAGAARQRLVAALGCGAAAGFVYAVHVRGTVVVFSHLLLVGAAVLLRRTPLRLAALSVGAVALAAALDPALKLAIRGAISTWGRSPKSQTVEAFTTLPGALRMLAGADGQLWYLGVATLGLGAVGVVSVLLPLLDRAARRTLLARSGVSGSSADGDCGTDAPAPDGSGTDRARWLVLVTLLAATVGIALSSSAALPPPDMRVTYYAYPRYIHFLFPLWFLVGLAALLQAPLRRAWLLAGAGAGLTLATGAVVYLRLQSVYGAVYHSFDGPEIGFLGWRWNAIGVARPTLAALALLAIGVAVTRWHARSTVAALAGLAVFNGVSMYVITDRISAPMVAPQYLADTPRLVRDVKLGPGDRVAVSSTQATWYTLFNHMREVHWEKIAVFDHLDEPVPADATVVVAPWRADRPELDWNGAEHGFHMIAEDTTHRWAVWRRGPARGGAA